MWVNTMTEGLTEAQRCRLETLWDVSQTDPDYKKMLDQMRELERVYEQVIEKMVDTDRDIVCDYISLCEGMSWRILEIASEKMIFRFERE